MNPKRTILTKRCGFLLPCLFAVLLFAVLVFCAPRAAAATVVASGTCGAQGDNLKWSLDSDGTLTISGKGEMKDYDFYTKAPWFKDDSDDLKRAIIKKGVTSIGKYAFWNCQSLKSITIPDGVTSVGEQAFYFCDTIESITLPNSVTTIGEEAFHFCYNLKSVTIPNSLNVIEVSTFDYCKSLISVTIPNSVKTIKTWAFSNCENLKNITIPNSVTLIEEEAFCECNSLTSISIPSSVQKICYDAFTDCISLKTVKVLNPNCEIQEDAFKNTPATIYGYKNSTAQVYAKENQMSFSELAHSHVYGAVVTERKATCYQTGLQYQACTLCGERGNEKTLPKTEHNYQTKVYAATTAKDGKVAEACAVCGLTRKSTKIPKIEVLKLDKTVCDYDGTRKTPVLIVKDSKGKTLKKSTDYKVKYASGRTKCGTYKVIVTFKGNYSGKHTLTFQILPGKVTGVRQVEGKGINIEWNTVAGATSYEVYAKKDQTEAYRYLATAAYEKFGNDAISIGTQMQFKVRAVAISADGTAVKGAFSKVLTAQCKPRQVTGLRQVKGKGIRLVWDENPDADYYEIYCREDDGTYQIAKDNREKEIHKKRGDESMWNKSVKANAVRYLKVRAVVVRADGSVVKGPFSKVLAATAQKNAKTNIPSSEEIHVHSFNSAVMERKASCKEDGKQWRTCSCGEVQTISTTPKIAAVKLEKTFYVYDGTTKTPTLTVEDSKGKALKKNTDYKVKYASGRKEYGTYKVIVTFIGNYSGKKTLTFQIVPAKVTHLKQTKGRGIHLAWNETEGATYYEIYCKDKTMNDFQPVEKSYGNPVQTQGTTLSNTTISIGIVMMFKVRAVHVCSDGSVVKGPFSNVLTATAQ